jgi:hypothetical protein
MTSAAAALICGLNASRRAGSLRHIVRACSLFVLRAPATPTGARAASLFGPRPRLPHELC